MTQHIIIIGTGLAGYLTAKAFRQHDKTTSLTMVTMSDGDFYSKPLLSTSLTHHRSPDQLPMRRAQDMRRELNADIFMHWRAMHIDSNNQTLICEDDQHHEKILSYDRLVLAVGAQSIQIPLQGNAAQNVLSVNQLEEYRIFRSALDNKKRVAILGSGLVGVEFANDLVNAGFSVDVISPDLYPLHALVPEPIGRALQQALQKLGVRWHLLRAATQVNRSNHDFAITLSDQSVVVADCILSAVGIKPNIMLAQSANLKTNLGIVANAQLQTSDARIYALGDCAEILGVLSRHIAPIMQAAPILGAILAGKNLSLHFPVMPVVVKTPACPIVAVPPKNHMGSWKIEGDAENVRALFYHQDQQLLGFALCGHATKDKTQLVQSIKILS